MPNANPQKVSDLTDHITEAMADFATTHQCGAPEIVSALFTVLDRTLAGVRKFQDPDDRFHNAREISRLLDEIKTDYGRVPS